MVLRLSLCFFLIPLAINYLFGKAAPYKIFSARWEASDALNYVAGSAAFIGTMFLGWVAWKQNSDLQNIEKTNFIAQNSCMALILSLKFKGCHSKANLPYCEEQIVKSNFPIESYYALDYSSFICEFSLKPLENCPAIVRVNSLILSITTASAPLIIFCKNYDNTYSRMAISQDHNRFSVIVLLKQEQKQRCEQLLNEKGCKVIIEADFDLVTGNLVATHIKCRAGLNAVESVSDSGKSHFSEFTSSNEDPMCFWYGNTILKKKEISFRREEVE